ncbi:hypothetical protein A33K_14345 [Burkholderia humptydooensis MSMB43]|uniref:Uncharacterized protein n=1 Tax=Burkholderia humptydooensis MSMB43 TaxID=441157 RepID=A0ABN0G7Y6_9BURK|nr:hypothetical protein A33K_14345 [Burkholderia humptydooensis MSMB43]
MRRGGVVHAGLLGGDLYGTRRGEADRIILRPNGCAPPRTRLR